MEHLVESILQKSRRLVGQRNALIEEKQQLKNRIVELEAALSNQELIINQLIEKQKIQQIAGVFGKEEKKASLKKIDEVVWEVDRCIALLNG